MSTFKFGEILVEVKRLRFSPGHPDQDFYSVKIIHPENDEIWLEGKMKQPHQRKHRTALSDFELANKMVGEAYTLIADPDPDRIYKLLQRRMSSQEIEAVMKTARMFAPYVEDAIVDAAKRKDIYLEHYEMGHKGR